MTRLKQSTAPDWESLPTMLPAPDVAAILGVTVTTLRVMVHKGRLTASRTRGAHGRALYHKEAVRCVWEARERRRAQYYDGTEVETVAVVQARQAVAEAAVKLEEAKAALLAAREEQRAAERRLRDVKLSGGSIQ